MTEKYVLDKESPFVEEGWIQMFLDRFDTEKGTWGNGIYGPKWVSTFYTMRDLRSLEIDPMHPIYQRGLATLVSHMWNPKVFVEDDVCVVAMLISLLVYGKYPVELVRELLNYCIQKQLSDGGWNCASKHKDVQGSLQKSSINTTLTVLEAYAEYEKEGYVDQLAVIKEQAQHGQAYLLRKKLMRRESNNDYILNYIHQFHFPTRWKYDVLRVLCYFASIKYPYDSRMDEGLTLLKEKFAKGYLTKGSTYSGRLHFQMETTKIGSMNTLRGLLVLKEYDVKLYRGLVQKEI